MKSLISALILPLVLVGFLTNSVAMRVFGKVEGDIIFPLAALLCNVVLALYLLSKINNKLSTNKFRGK